MIRFAAAICFLLLLPASIRADGGALQFTKKAGPYTVTLFTAPVPMRVGSCDLSVMVQRSDDLSPVLDAQVDVSVTKRDVEITAPATRENATNKLLYAGNVDFPASGRWKVQVLIKNAAGEAVASGDLTVLDSQPPIIAYWPYFAIVPLAILLFVMNQRLKERRLHSQRR